MGQSAYGPVQALRYYLELKLKLEDCAEDVKRTFNTPVKAPVDFHGTAAQLAVVCCSMLAAVLCKLAAVFRSFSFGLSIE